VDRFRKALAVRFKNDKEAFDAMDLNSDGEVTFVELVSFYELHDLEGDAPVDLRRLFNLMDADGSGTLEFDEILKVTRNAIKGKLRVSSRVEAGSLSAVQVSESNHVERFRKTLVGKWGTLNKAFGSLDLNANGDLSYGEISSGLDRASLSMVDDFGYIDLKKVFRAMDVDSSGEISTWEFQGVWPPKKKKVKKETKEAPKAKTAKKKAKAKPRGKGQKTPGASDLVEGARPPGNSVWMRRIEYFATVSVKQFSLDFACVGDWGAERLALAMPHPSGHGMREMQAMSLDSNYIGDKGATVLASAIEACCKLRQLSLARNGIGDAGAAKLSAMSCKVSTLQVMNLANNRICHEGGRVFAKDLARTANPKPKLHTLDLRGNEIGHSAVSELRKAVGSNMNLTVDGNPGAMDMATTAPEGFWGSDPGYKVELKATTVDLPKRRMPDFKSLQVAELTTDLISVLSSQTGDQWGPSKRLLLHMTFAKQLGSGMRPRSDASALRRAGSETALSRRASAADVAARRRSSFGGLLDDV